MVEDTVKTVAGREANAAVIPAALKADAATTWKASDMLKTAFENVHVPHSLVPELPAFNVAKGAVDRVAPEQRGACVYIDFISKAMVPKFMGSLTGEVCYRTTTAKALATHCVIWIRR